MLGFGRWRKRAATSSAALIVAAGCASFNDSSEGPGGSQGVGDGGDTTLVVEGGTADAGHLNANASPLCGTTDYCLSHLPDDVNACADFDAGSTHTRGGSPPDAAAGTGGAPNRSGADASESPNDGGLTDGGDAALDGSAGDASDGAPREIRDAQGDADDASVALDSGSPGHPKPPPIPAVDAGSAFACQVESDNSGKPVHRCSVAGPGATASPCTASTDCRAGLACVGKPGAGQCRPYCCDVVNHPCGEGTFCAERPLLELGKPRANLPVPVCFPVDNCSLAEPYPCTGSNCICTGGTACTIVRGDGATSCVLPGGGRTDDHCPCDAGFFCSQAVGRCVKICKTGTGDGECAPGMCQATAGFPTGFGLCVGAKPSVN